MTIDLRVQLQEIRDSFADKYGKWVRRESGNAQLALDLAEHQAELEKLMGLLCEQLNIFSDEIFKTHPVISKDDGSETSVDSAEVSNPGR